METKNKQPNCVAIVSGGMDSTTMLHYLVKGLGLTPAVISFIYGQKHDREVEYAAANVAELGLQHHSVIDLAPLADLFRNSGLVSDAIEIPNIVDVMGDPQPVTYVPNRNMIFLALATAYAETNEVTDVYYGAQRHDIYGYWDTTPQFLESLNKIYSLNRKTPVTIKAPFVTFSKTDILQIGLDLGIDYGTTWSCYNGAEQACGTCPTCAERLQAFHELDLTDPLPYKRIEG